jgi:hypothetical protein
MGNYLCESFTWFFCRGDSSLEIPEIISKVSKSLCKIQIREIIYPGFLINLTAKNKNIFCIIIDNHIITNDMINKNEKVKLYYDKDSKNVLIDLNKNERYIKHLNDEIIIEILPKDGIQEDFFLLPDLNYINQCDKLKNSKIIIINNIGHFYGKIDKINCNEFTYTIDNNLNNVKIKSGNPIFLLDSSEVIGITKEININTPGNYADFLGYIHNILQKEDEKEKIKIELEDGGYYIGEINQDNIPNGKGEYYFKNGEKYEGDIIKDTFEGNGKYIYENGENYIGQWKNDLKHGTGILYNKNKCPKYEGGFVNDVYEGYGKYYWENGEYYIGQFKNGLNYGKGILYYKNGNIKYTGDFVNDKFEGNGKYIYEDGEYYIGHFKNGVKNGKGILYYKNGNIEYEGEFLEGKFDGKGKYFYENGNYYMGQFKNGLSHGKGKEYDIQGNIINEGEWVNDFKI